MKKQSARCIGNLTGTGTLVIAVLCILLVLAAGCTNAGTTSPTPAATGIQSSGSSFGSTASKVSFDPIVGVWRSPGAVYTFEITFELNGKTEERYSSVPHVYYNGTWLPVGDNTYLVTRESGEKTIWVHDLSKNILYKKDTPRIVYTLYQGPGSTGSSALLSGTGDSVVPFTATGSGVWIFTLHHSGEGNFIVWIKDDQGKRLFLLSNEIGIYSGTKPQNLNAGKYYLNVTASGPWTIQAAVS
jgi:hypothetical protein